MPVTGWLESSSVCLHGEFASLAASQSINTFFQGTFSSIKGSPYRIALMFLKHEKSDRHVSEHKALNQTGVESCDWILGGEIIGHGGGWKGP